MFSHLLENSFFGASFVLYYISYFEVNSISTSSPTNGSTQDITRIYLFYSEVAKTKFKLTKILRKMILYQLRTIHLSAQQKYLTAQIVCVWSNICQCNSRWKYLGYLACYSTTCHYSGKLNHNTLCNCNLYKHGVHNRFQISTHSYLFL